MGKLFGTDGIRGIFNKELDPTLAYRVGEALIEVLSEKGVIYPKVLIGMDTRQSSPLLSAALTEGITEKGGRATNIGVCSTPAIAYHLLNHAFDAGVMISASHNPYTYNGIKIFGSNGYKISDDDEEKIEKYIFRENITPDAAKKEYINYLKGSFKISLEGLKIGIDCANGSASVTAKELFNSLGAECYLLNDAPDGKNINKDCGSTNLADLKRLVLSKKLDVGIAFDGDADRCIAVDELGHEIDGDYIIAILAMKLKEEKKLNKNTVVGTVMTNLGLIKFCEKNGIVFKSSAVGDRFVLEKLNEENYSLGGEQSGHIIFSDIATTGDGQLTALALLSAIKESGKSLSTLAAIMTKYPQITINIEANELDKKALIEDDTIKKIIKEAENSVLNKGKIIVRPSGTEAMIRVTVESSTKGEAKEICYALTDKINKRLRELNSSVR